MNSKIDGTISKKKSVDWMNDQLHIIEVPVNYNGCPILNYLFSILFISPVKERHSDAIFVLTDREKNLYKILPLPKYRKGDGPTKIFPDLAGGLSVGTIKRWCQMINSTGSSDLAYSSSRPNAWNNWKGADTSGRVSVQKLRICRILKEDLKYRSYKQRV